DQGVAHLFERGVAIKVGVSLFEYDAVRAARAADVDRPDAATLGTHADLRCLGHIDFGEEVARGGIEARELDASGLPDGAAAAIATDEVVAAQGFAIGEVDIHA